MMDMVGTQRDTVGTRPIPKKKRLKCAIPLTLLFFFFFFNSQIYFFFYSFSPFALFSLFCPCVPFIVLSTCTLSHMKSSFISSHPCEQIKDVQMGTFKEKKFIYDLKSITHQASYLTFYNSFFHYLGRQQTHTLFFLFLFLISGQGLICF